MGPEVILKHNSGRKIRKNVLENKTVMHMKHVAVCTVCGYGFITKGTHLKTCGDSECVNAHKKITIKKLQRAWAIRNKDKLSKYNAEYRQEHKEELVKKAKEYYQRNKEYIKAKTKKILYRQLRKGQRNQ